MSFMAHAIRRPPKTVRDYMALPEDVRAELIGGEIYVAPSPSSMHQQVACRIWEALNAWVRSAAVGGVVLTAPDVRLPSGDIVRPDVLLVTRTTRREVHPWRRRVPDLAVEVVSPSHLDRDRIVKRALYAKNGVTEYWIVDLEAEAVEILRAKGRKYRPAGYFEKGSVLTTPTCPGLVLSLDELFALLV